VPWAVNRWSESRDAADRLTRLLEEGRTLGFLGPGPVDGQIQHALSMGRVVGSWDVRALDLGSGAGLPGLVLAIAQPSSRWVLLDAHRGRTRFLERAVALLGLAPRVTVVRERAEVAGRRPELREAFGLVTVRGFGPPAVVAECGAALVAPGGALVVSDPPDPSPDRWPASALAELGLRARTVADDGGARVTVLDKATPCPDWVPRRTGVPAKRPLF
jgi:16S rRNA (guanine527-N7)-methyltransferase